MPRFVLVYLGWEERLRTGEEANANSRTSENSVKRKFAEGRLAEVQLPNTLRHQGLRTPS
jgi:hypothetical protein